MADNNEKQEVTSEEFKRKLIDWFDNRGILSELRSYMRHQMISALNSSGQDAPCQSSRFAMQTPVSPTLQALLLLVAEFLVQQEYHYTVSVMVAEVPLLASFPKFAEYVRYMSSSVRPPSNKISFPRYSKKDVVEILETLGIPSDSECSHHILRLYGNNEARESLLACALTALPAVAQCYALQQHTEKRKCVMEESAGSARDMDEAASWLEEIRLVLLRAQLTAAQLQQVEDLLSRLHSSTISRVRKEEQIKHSQLIQIRQQQLQAEALVKEEELRARIDEAEEDLDKKQIHLEKVTTQLRQQHDEVLSRLNRIQRHADEVRLQEEQLAVRESQLVAREGQLVAREGQLVAQESKLSQKERVLEEERLTLVSLRTDLQDAARSLRQDQSDSRAFLELHHLQERCGRLEAELEETRKQLKSSLIMTEVGVQATGAYEGMTERKEDGPSTKDVAVGQNTKSGNQQLFSSASSFCSTSCNNSPSKYGDERKERHNQITLLKRVLRRVQQENSELRANSIQQRRRIDELTNHAASLAAHLAARSEAPLQAQPVQPTAGPSSPPPPLPPPMPQPQRHRYVPQSTRLGAGEQPTLHTSRPSPTTTAHAFRLQGREWRRKPPKRLLQHVSHPTNLSSDDSPTEEVMREARSRLRRLEQETDEVDRNYRDFCERRSSNLSSTASVMYVPTSSTPQNVAPLITTHRTEPSQLSSSFQFRSTYSPLVTSTGLSAINSAYRSPLASSLRPSATSILTRLPQTAQSLSQSSQLTYPARTTEKVQYRPSALRRPTERIRDLLGSRLSLLKDYSLDGNKIPGVPEQSEFSPRPSSSKRNSDDTDVSRTLQELRALNLESARQLEKVEEIPHVPSQRQSEENVEGASPGRRTPSRAPSVQDNLYSSAQNNARATVLGSALRESAVSVISGNESAFQTSAPKSEGDLAHASSSNLALKIIQDDDKAQPVGVPVVQEEKDKKVQISVPVRLAEKEEDRQPSQTPQPNSERILHHSNMPDINLPRSIFLESTLNEVSTLSSSTVVSPRITPPLGHVNTGLQDLKKSSQNGECGVTAVHRESTPPKQGIITSSPVDESNKQPVVTNTEDPNVSGTALQLSLGSDAPQRLQNASLSSINISDQAISVGSEEKKTSTDTDDFW